MTTTFNTHRALEDFEKGRHPVTGIFIDPGDPLEIDGLAGPVEPPLGIDHPAVRPAGETGSAC